jgi:hypothetical protein
MAVIVLARSGVRAVWAVTIGAEDSATRPVTNAIPRIILPPPSIANQPAKIAIADE